MLDSNIQIVVGYGALLTQGRMTAPDAHPVTLDQHDRSETEQSLRAQVLSAVCFKTGTLRIVFDNGSNLNVKSAEEFVPAAVISDDTVMWMRSKTENHH